MTSLFFLLFGTFGTASACPLPLQPLNYNDRG
jgi:hypothetical protein